MASSSSGLEGVNIAGRKLLLPGQWYELAITYDGNEGSIYVDSELLAHGGGTVMANDQPIYIGGAVGRYDSFLGALDELRVYTNVLSHDDISLKGVWHLDENGGTFIGDSSIRGHHGVASSPSAWISGKQGYGLNLSNTMVTIPNEFLDVLPPTGKPFSLSFWLYPITLPEGWCGLMNSADGNRSGWQLAVQRAGQGLAQLRFWSTESGGTLDLSTPIALPDQSWSKLDITFNGGIATLYVNGLRIHSGSGGIQGSSVPLVIGASPGIASFNGIIDELKIYDRERDETEIGPVAKVMWETVLLNTSSNLVLQGAGPVDKELTYTIVDTILPTNGVLTHPDVSPILTYTAGLRKGPDAF